MLKTSFNLEILWNGRHTAVVTVPATYWNATCGLCGNFDGEAENDFRLPGGLRVRIGRDVLPSNKNSLLWQLIGAKFCLPQPSKETPLGA